MGKRSCHQAREPDLNHGTSWWKESFNSHRLSSDLYMCAIVYAHLPQLTVISFINIYLGGRPMALIWRSEDFL